MVMSSVEACHDTHAKTLVFIVQELVALYATIDRAEEVVGRVFAAAKSASDRLDQLNAGYEQKYPEGFAKALNWLGSKVRVADAPVKLPAWEPATARVNAAAELELLQQAVGVSALSPAVLAAALGQGGATAKGGADAAAEAEEDEEEEEEAGAGGAAAAAAASSSATPSRRGGAGVGAGEDEEDEEDDDDDDEDEGRAVAAPAPAPAAARRVAAGEDDDEEEEDDDEE